jgi:PD-(D/E)XK endonuclease
MTRQQQGDLGEISAVEWFVSQGVKVALPVGHSPDWDLIAELTDGVVRVQVKTSNFTRHGRWEVAVCTRGGNQSWGGVVKRFAKSRCDYLFAHVGDGRRWLIPADKVQGATSVILGGPKYATFEIERGRPLPRLAPSKSDALESSIAPGGAPELESRARL